LDRPRVLPSCRIGRRVWISRADFDEFITRGSTSDAVALVVTIWDDEIPDPQIP
jgi:hypothetical protein